MSKENYCLRIMNKYSLIVNFDGDPPGANVPGPVDGETLGPWQRRVLGEGATNVKYYMPTKLAPNRRVLNLSKEAHAEHIQRMFGIVKKTLKVQKKEAVADAVSETFKRLAAISKNSLEEILEVQRDAMEPSVREFFDRLVNEVEEEIEIETLLSRLVIQYNLLVSETRKIMDISKY